MKYHKLATLVVSLANERKLNPRFEACHSGFGFNRPAFIIGCYKFRLDGFCFALLVAVFFLLLSNFLQWHSLVTTASAVLTCIAVICVTYRVSYSLWPQEYLEALYNLTIELHSYSSPWNAEKTLSADDLDLKYFCKSMLTTLAERIIRCEEDGRDLTVARERLILLGKFKCRHVAALKFSLVDEQWETYFAEATNDIRNHNEDMAKNASLLTKDSDETSYPVSTECPAC